MDKIHQQAIITIVKSALTGLKYDLPDGIEVDKVILYAKKSQITGMIYSGMVNCGISKDLPAMRQLFMTVCNAVSVDEEQSYEFSKIAEAFEGKGIKYLPMKGALIKKLYPESSMRSMSDLDVLIDEKQYDSIAKIMESLGYEKGEESDHELPWKKGRVYVELHRRMISTHNKDFYSYFGDGWKYAQPSKGSRNRFELGNEDVYIYLFTHFVKHYRSGGIGIKHITDLWVYRKAYPGMDMQRVYAALDEMKLSEFHKNVEDTLRVWFENADSNDITDLITYVIFKSGAFGNYDDRLAALVIRDMKTEKKKRNRITQIIELFFPTYKKMCEKYRILRKHPILLPFMWVYRGVSVLTGDSKKLKKISKKMSVVTSDKVELYHKSLQKVGLDFNFEE